MLGTLKKYALIYREFFATCLAEATTYRMHFVLLIVMDLLFYATTLTTVDFIYQHVSAVGPWDRNQFMFFLAFLLTVDQLHMTFVSESFWVLSASIRNGDLDFLIIKPVNLYFLIFLRHIRPASMLLCFVTVFLLWHFGTKAGLGWVQFMLLPVLLILALLFLVSLEILISASMFWLVEGTGVNFFRMQLQQVSRWPDFVFYGLPRRFFTFVIPVLLIGNAPVQFLFSPFAFSSLLWMIGLTVVIWVLIERIWSKALRQYESASS